MYDITAYSKGEVSQGLPYGELYGVDKLVEYFQDFPDPNSGEKRNLQELIAFLQSDTEDWQRHIDARCDYLRTCIKRLQYELDWWSSPHIDPQDTYWIPRAFEDIIKRRLWLENPVYRECEEENNKILRELLEQD